MTRILAISEPVKTTVLWKLLWFIREGKIPL